MGLTASLSALSQWWAVYYADHQMVSLVVRYLHLAALMVGGGPPWRSIAWCSDRRGRGPMTAGMPPSARSMGRTRSWCRR